MPNVGNSSKVGRPLPSRLTRQSDYTVVSAGLGMRKQGVNLLVPRIVYLNLGTDRFYGGGLHRSLFLSLNESSKRWVIRDFFRW